MRSFLQLSLHELKVDYRFSKIHLFDSINFLILSRLKKIMIIGKIKKNEKSVRLNTDINCTNCGKQVPGGIKTSEKYSVTNDFKKELEEFKKNYLCGICRDKKRVNKS